VLDVVVGMLCITLLPWMAVSRRTDDDSDEIGDAETNAAPEGATS